MRDEGEKITLSVGSGASNTETIDISIPSTCNTSGKRESDTRIMLSVEKCGKQHENCDTFRVCGILMCGCHSGILLTMLVQM